MKKNVSTLFLFLAAVLAPTMLCALFTGIHHSGFTFEQIEKYTRRFSEPETVFPHEYALYSRWEKQHRDHLALFKRMAAGDARAVHALNELVTDILTQQYNATMAGDYAFKITLPPSTQCILFGDLQGAFHSLVRNLGYLVHTAVLKNDLRLSSGDTCLVFNGNVVSGAPFALETLVVVLLLIVRNPGRVFYLKGPNECLRFRSTPGYGAVSGPQRARMDETQIALFTLIDLLFERLPLALYIAGVDPNKGLIRISHTGRDSSRIDEHFCSDALRSLRFGAPERCIFASSEPQFSREAPPISVIIKSEDRLKSYKNFTGLCRLEPDLDSAAWRIFSGPSPLYRNYFSFGYDSFVVLTMDQDLDNAELRHFYTLIDRRSHFYTVERSAQWLETLQPFSMFSDYKLISGEVIHGPHSLSSPGMLRHSVLAQKLKLAVADTEQPIAALPDQLRGIQKKIEKLSRGFVSTSDAASTKLVSRECNQEAQK